MKMDLLDETCSSIMSILEYPVILSSLFYRKPVQSVLIIVREAKPFRSSAPRSVDTFRAFPN